MAVSTLRRDNGIPATTPEPITVKVETIIVIGMALWAVALVLTLVVPALHEGGRDWWPWSCLAGLVLGGIGLTYVRRGRGNARTAHEGAPAEPQSSY